MPQSYFYNWLVYILKLRNGAYYTGITNNLEKRLNQHSRGKGSKIVRSFCPFELVYLEQCKDRSAALKREVVVKKKSRKQKEILMSDFCIEPLFDRVFIKKDDAEKTDTGLFLPDSVKGRATTGVVVAVGPGQRNHLGEYLTPSIKTGQRVFVKEFSGYIIRYKGEEVYLFQENEIIGVVKE